MTWLVENPWPALCAGIVIEIALLVALIRSGRGRFLYGIVGVLFVTVALVTLEHWVVTEREEVENTIDAAARALEKNDPGAVVEFIAPSMGELRTAVRNQLSKVIIRRVAVMGDLNIEVHQEQTPHTASARFSVLVTGNDRQGAAPYENYLFKLDVSFEKENGRWLATSYREIRGQKQR